MTASQVPPHPEIAKLARLLRVEASTLSFLGTVDEQDLATFRGQVTDVLFDANTATLKRLASAAKLLPSAVLAKIAEAVFGPLLCARIAGLIDPVKAAEVAKRLSPAFLADVAAELDPRRADGVVGMLPPKIVTPVARELAQREDWITLGRFVGVLRDEPLAACIGELTEAALLYTAVVVEEAAAIAQVINLLPRARREVLLSTVGELGLWPIVLNRLTLLPERTVADLAELLTQLDPALLHGLATTVVEHRLWSDLLPLVKVLPAAAKDIVAEHARALASEVRAEILAEAQRRGVAADLGSIGDALTAQAA